MSNCVVTVRSTIDEVVSQTEYQGTLSVCATKVELRYADGASLVTVTAEDGLVQIDRTGDYSLCLPLKSGETSVGAIGVSGAVGEVNVRCQKVEYKIKENAFLLVAQYSLLFGEEEQRTGIRLYARGI